MLEALSTNGEEIQNWTVTAPWFLSGLVGLPLGTHSRRARAAIIVTVKTPPSYVSPPLVCRPAVWLKEELGMPVCVLLGLVLVQDQVLPGDGDDDYFALLLRD